MDLERKLMKQMEGKTVSITCTKCNKETKITIDKNATGKCSNCGAKAKVDLSGVIEDLKKLGVS